MTKRPGPGRPSVLGGILATVFWAASLHPAGAGVVSAQLTQPTTRYQHGILGDSIEYGALQITLHDGSRVTLTLPDTRVFEDIAPRLADIDGDENAEVIVVETSLTRGARLSIYDETGLIAATPYIGRTHRWLAPIAAADLDGDGAVEIAYIDRPHLAKVLRVWRLRDGGLVEVAHMDGLTNHRIGWNYILGGLRDCGADGTELITASGDWSRVMATQLLANGQLTTHSIGPYTGPDSIAAALDCR